jgi:replicative DNA helicase
MSSVGVQRVPPHSTEAEQAVLGGILLDSRRINDISDSLMPEHFYSSSHQKIYQAILELSHKGEPIDLLTLTDKLEKAGVLNEIGGVEYLGELAGATPTAANAVAYAKIIREKSILRQVIGAGLDIVAEGFEEPPDVEEYLDSVEKRVFEISKEKIDKPFHLMRDVVAEAFKRIEELDASTGDVSGIPSGLIELDRLTTGFHPAELLILAARPSMGKTSLALNIAQNAAIQHGKAVGIFSLEMSRQELVIRMLCSLGKVDSQKFRTGKLGDAEWLALSEAADKLNDSRIYIDDSADIHQISLRSKARRMKAQHGLDMIMIDYLQLMRAYGMKRDANREQEISTISRSLKALAKELEIPVLALSQLNRELEHRTNKRPMMSDLRESGAIEQDADVIMFIYRDAVYNPDNIESENIAELIVAKHRAGPTGLVKLRYFREYTLFENLALDDDYGSY